MEATCKVFLAPRAAPGEPTVRITRAPSGFLLGAVACDCPPGGACATHCADDLLERARAHHKAVAPLVPCMFKMDPPAGQTDRALVPGTQLLQQMPATSPYPPTSADAVVAADPANVTPGKTMMLSYVPACVFTGPTTGLGGYPPARVTFAKGSSYRSTALAGLVLTASVAHDMTDGVPIVNQILGAVSRIATLAQKIERDREALHALAVRSQKLARSITATLAGRAPEGEIMNSLQRARTVLTSVDDLFLKHVAKARLRRALSYLVSVPRDVERLSAELADALQEFLIVAALDTNARVQADSRSAGQFRRLHDFEIEELQLVARMESDDGSSNVLFHAARVEGSGRLFVVRYFKSAESDSAADGTEPLTDAMDLQRRVRAHDEILEHISTVEDSHPKIAYLYGRGTGYRHNRLTVLRTGYRPLAVTVRPKGLALASIWAMLPKLLDAARHVNQFGAVWIPNTHMLSDNIFLDDRGEPTIGLINNDLQTSESVSPENAYENQLFMLSTLFGWTHTGDGRQDESWRALLTGSAWPYSQIGSVVEAGWEIGFQYSMVQHSEHSDLPPLDHRTLSYLRNAETALDATGSLSDAWGWDHTLRRVATGSSHRIANGLRAIYNASPGPDSWDFMLLHRIADDGEQVQHLYDRDAISSQKTTTVPLPRKKQLYIGSSSGNHHATKPSPRLRGVRIYTYFAFWPANVVDLSFFLDDVPPKRYTRGPGGGPGPIDWVYDTMAFMSDLLPLGEHTLLVVSPGGKDTTLQFDFAIYSTEDSDDADPNTVSSTQRPDSQTPTVSAPGTVVGNGGRSSTTSRGFHEQPASSSSTTSAAHPDRSKITALGAGLGGGALMLLVACGILVAWRRKQRLLSGHSTSDSTLAPFYARQNELIEADAPDKRRLWDAAEKIVQGQNCLPLTRGAGANPEDALLEDGAALRAQMTRLLEENERALDEIAMLRRGAEPPPYSEGSRTSQRGNR
ncbi:hypothetical protein AURDEDRAFT_175800 [Auricularia subglabra TFB-10046 SS5]|uniref:Uncharacterized protein n=1 Tax=Auricularia subglabra (strain TFB-10046 / SS5) TaxID=717982 RepID=J0WR24_AURST|nr:hypothetical protein AURDEDRAFT_175800 [Auricularia subglabra TFB-10046 SS5]